MDDQCQSCSRTIPDDAPRYAIRIGEFYRDEYGYNKQQETVVQIQTCRRCAMALADSLATVAMS